MKLLNLTRKLKLIGSCALIGAAFFSVDRNYFGLHGISAFIGFFSFIFGIGLKLRKWWQKIAFIGSSLLLLLFFTIMNPLFEWILVLILVYFLWREGRV